MRVNQTVAGHSCGRPGPIALVQKAVTQTIDYVVAGSGRALRVQPRVKSGQIP